MLGVANDIWRQGSVSPAKYGTLAAWYALQDPYEVTYQDGTGEQVDDWDLEETDTSSWDAGSDAVLTKETSAPHEGLRWMKIAYGGIANPYAKQNTTCVVGATYYNNGWGRGDGTYGVRWMVGGVIWVGGTGTSWENQKKILVAVATYARYQVNTSEASFAGVDSLSLTECPGITKARNLANPGVDDLVQATVGYAGVSGPSWGADGGLDAGITDGSDDYWTADGLASIFAGTTGIDWSVGLTVDIDGVSGDQAIWCAGRSDSANGHVRVWLDDADLKLTRWNDSGTALTVTLKTSISTGRHSIVVAIGSSTVDCWVDGVLEADGLGFVYSDVTPDQFSVAARRRDTIDDYFAGKFRDCVVYSDRVTDGAGLSAWLEARSPLS